MGQSDGIPNADWASEICGVAAGDIRPCDSMAQNRTMISVSWSLTRRAWRTRIGQRSLASLLSDRLPGGGIGFGYTAEHCIGNDFDSIPAAAAQGKRVNSSIPVARVADMLLEPGHSSISTANDRRTPISSRLGGRQPVPSSRLNRLLAAWRKPDTIIVNDWCWNANARHADIVLPCTTALERRRCRYETRPGGRCNGTSCAAGREAAMTTTFLLVSSGDGC